MRRTLGFALLRVLEHIVALLRARRDARMLRHLGERANAAMNADYAQRRRYIFGRKAK